jgi:hypothetical protein
VTSLLSAGIVQATVPAQERTRVGVRRIRLRKNAKLIFSQRKFATRFQARVLLAEGRESDRGGLRGRLRGGRRCRDAPRPAGDMTFAGAAGGVTAADCEAGSAVAGGAVTLPGRPAAARA